MATTTRKIGDARVPFPGLGCMGMSAFYSGAGNDEENLKTLKAAYDAGNTFWDTADIYGNKGMGENERLIGRAIKELGLDRNRLFIATKFGHHIGHYRGTSFNPDMASQKRSIRGDPEYIKEAIEKSLKDLGLPYVDLYYQHRVDPTTPIEETVKAMAELKAAGKVKYLGLSECSAETLRKASQVAKIDALEVEYSLWETSVETNGLLDTCKELGVALVAYSPLGRGMLAGKFKSPDDFEEGDTRRFIPRFYKENFHKNLELVDEVSKLAQKKGCTTSQLALAWLHAQWEGVIAIPGSVHVKRAQENFESANVTLTKEELDEIRGILNTITVAGERHNPAGMATVDL